MEESEKEKVFKILVLNGLMIIAMLLAVGFTMTLGKIIDKKYTDFADTWQAKAKKYIEEL